MNFQLIKPDGGRFGKFCLSLNLARKLLLFVDLLENRMIFTLIFFNRMDWLRLWWRRDLSDNLLVTEADFFNKAIWNSFNCGFSPKLRFFIFILERFNLL
jgi:hypothetical protein